MSDLMRDVSSLYGTHKTDLGNEVTIAKKGSNLDLDMTSFIQLMITQLTSQGIDNTMDTSEMLNQMVQMQMITSMVNMTDAVTMNYAASLVNQKVTVGKYGEDGKLQEIYGTVTGTGTINGQQVIFLDDKEYYYLSEIMAVGKLPPPEEDDKVDGTEKPENPDGAEKPENPDGAEKPENPDEIQKPENPDGGTETPDPGGENGAPTGGEG
ncbi:MAG: flagellar hook capping protein [Oscillibacter sp.]|nr:flagellar hook capping protein [Oscillibacter sp.]